MPQLSNYQVRQLTAAPNDVTAFREQLSLFGEVFEDIPTYTHAQPGDNYLRKLLGGEHFIALVAVQGGIIIGGLTAYVWQKFEQERSEIYIYDLAVAVDHRRRGVATALITHLRQIGSRIGAYVIIVQADPPDAPAVALYTKLGRREDVLHFDIPIN